MNLLSCRVMLVEDFLWFRDFVRSKLELCPELLLIGEASDGLKAVEDATSLQPDLILLDIGLPSLNGIEVARQLRELAPKSKIIFLSQETSAVLVKEAIALGAWGYVFKSHAEGDLLPAIDAALSGRRYVSSNPQRGDVPHGDDSDRI
jgi:DNA-binding NarL/FixJ family response regulator